MGLGFDNDGDEVPTLINSSDTLSQAGVIGKVPITIVTGYLGAGSMSGFPTKVSDVEGIIDWILMVRNNTFELHPC